MSVMRKATAVAAGTLFLLGAVAGPSQAKQNTVVQNGLVNVTVGDVIAQDAVDIGVAASVAATLCDVVDVGSIAVLGTAVDVTGKKDTICGTESGPVRIVNNATNTA